MKLGFLTACLPGESLDDIATWAGTQGFEALEVAAWPDRPGRDWEASHLDVEHFDADAAAQASQLLASNGLQLSAIAYYENNLHTDPATREATHEHLRRCIDAAALLKCGLVGTFVGRDINLTVAENLRLGEAVLPPLVDYAAARGVRLVIENCPMEGWHPDGYPANLAYSPELWAWLTSIGLYLNFDPSHLGWLGIDPIEALDGHLDRVLHVQAKDVEIDRSARNQYGFFGQVVDKPSPWTSGWWRYRVPGLGQLDWQRIMGALRDGGFDGTVSIEHEDPVWSGSIEQVHEGLDIAQRTLAPLLRNENSREA